MFMLLELFFGWKRFDASYTQKVRSEIVLAVVYFFPNILGLSALGPITAKKSDDNLKIRHTAGIKFNETVN